MKKIVTVIGARPQFIKAAGVSNAFKNNGNFNEIIIHTGQHFDKNMSDIFFEEMNISAPKYNLQINGLNHGAMTGQMLEGIEKILEIEKPDWVLVYGDTNSTLAGALAARKLNINIAHIESGLRSYNMQMPEEINRIITDRISNILFCTSDAAINNLIQEGFDKFDSKIIKTGDVMLDTALHYSALTNNNFSIVKKLGLKEFVLATIHRAENTNDLKKLSQIVSALNYIAKKIQIIVPLHPRTKKAIIQLAINPEFTIIDPVGYLEMIALLKACKLVVTDSGGVQKEAYFFGKNSITLREETEWVELLNGGFTTCVGADEVAIINGFENFINKENDFSNPYYGDGNAAKIIVESLS
jgi:UDP-GlcNAc3NAcA epimerase